MLVNPLLIIRKIIENKILIKSQDGLRFLFSPSRDISCILEPISFHRSSITNLILYGTNNSSESIIFGWGDRPTIILSFDDNFTINLYKNSRTYVKEFLLNIDKDLLDNDNILQLTLEYGIRKVELTDDQYNLVFGIDE